MKELKLQTPAESGRSAVEIALTDKTMVLGSCFADSIGTIMSDLGFDVCVNPFGTLYNPVSICNSLARLNSGMPFTEDECVPMGAGAGLVCSFSHHTSFARKTVQEFLDNANAEFVKASASWEETTKVIISLGTAWCFEYSKTGETVSNCLKIDAKEFTRRRLSIKEVTALLLAAVTKNPEKQFIFTVSPIRHLNDGAHGNQLSKSTLLIAVDNICQAFPEQADYFPAYEILMDELRDYRFYAEDMVHPSQQAIEYLWSRFVGFAVPEGDLHLMEENEKALRRSRHRDIH